MLVDNPTHHKLDPKWTGPWIVQKVIDANSVRVKKDAREQVVRINRICPQLLRVKKTLLLRNVKRGHLPCLLTLIVLGMRGSLLIIIVLMYKMLILPQGPHTVDVSFAPVDLYGY